MYILLDANVTAAYYLPRSTRSLRVRERIELIFDSVRSGARDDFFYLPNFCVAEVFSVFMKHNFGKWNSQVKSGTIDTRHYNRIVKQFEKDIHNGSFIYHYELSRYHVLGINLVAPVDHYFQIGRPNRRNTKAKPGAQRKSSFPMGTFDHLIVSMGIQLAHIHGREEVAIISADTRLTDVLEKCKSEIPSLTRRKLGLNHERTSELTGRKFGPEIFLCTQTWLTALTPSLSQSSAFGSPLWIRYPRSGDTWGNAQTPLCNGARNRMRAGGRLRQVAIQRVEQSG